MFWFMSDPFPSTFDFPVFLDAGIPYFHLCKAKGKKSKFNLTQYISWESDLRLKYLLNQPILMRAWAQNLGLINSSRILKATFTQRPAPSVAVEKPTGIAVTPSSCVWPPPFSPGVDYPNTSSGRRFQWYASLWVYSTLICFAGNSVVS